MYVRFIMLMSMFILISISNEIITYDSSKSWRTVSLLLTIWLIFCFVAMIILIFSLSISFTGAPNDYHIAFEEFFRGIKGQIETRLYVFAQFMRKFYFVALLVIYPSVDISALISMLTTYQLIYLALLIYLHPFVEKKANVVEIMNEVIFSILLISKFFLKSQPDWSTGITNMYISVIVGNIIIIFVISSCKLIK